jgi:ABC-2 type transport system permease protein
VTQHYDDFLRGVIDSQHIIYFLSIILVALFITTRLVESRRWR